MQLGLGVVADRLVGIDEARRAFAVSVGVSWLDLTSFEQYVWFSFVGAVATTLSAGGGVGTHRS